MLDIYLKKGEEQFCYAALLSIAIDDLCELGVYVSSSYATECDCVWKWIYKN